MAEVFYPVEGATTASTEAMYRSLFGSYSPTQAGVVPRGYITDKYDFVGLGSSLKPYGDSGGMNVKVNPGVAVCQGVVYLQDSLVAVPLSASSASNPRIDVIVLKYDFTGDIELSVVEGTPAASPSIPSVTRTGAVYHILLGYVYVGAGVVTISAGSVYDTRQFCTQKRSLSFEIVCDVGDGAGDANVVDGFSAPSAMQLTRVDVVANTSGTVSLELKSKEGLVTSLGVIELSSAQRYYADRGFSAASNDSLNDWNGVVVNKGSELYVVLDETTLVDITSLTMNVEYYDLGGDDD